MQKAGCSFVCGGSSIIYHYQMLPQTKLTPATMTHGEPEVLLPTVATIFKSTHHPPIILTDLLRKNRRDKPCRELTSEKAFLPNPASPNRRERWEASPYSLHDCTRRASQARSRGGAKDHSPDRKGTSAPSGACVTICYSYVAGFPGII